MTIFDTLFFNVFEHYKPSKKKKANTIALYYITTLQCGLLLLSGIFVTAFLNEMNSISFSSESAWVLFVLLCIVIMFRNWMQYSGKKRTVLKAKLNSKKTKEHYNINLLWFLLIVSVVLPLIMLSVI
ncbi:hypothetical protein [Psychroserpens damuponensis]|uniref:hypothetical protein n=1 Tax=Psychroserpens damuponensis TaxID=943936 RepID=UPI0005904AB6|nr:hypothetical protein [Psychroserpens damuponensis]